MEIKQLRYFLAVCKCGNITQAAEELYITQQTLSKQIKNFEAELGAPLFTRSVRGAEPTEYAKKLLEPATQIVWVADQCPPDTGRDASGGADHHPPGPCARRFQRVQSLGP